METIKNLINKDLAGFKIIEATEVHNVDEQGLYTSSIGFFKNPVLAKAFAGQKKETNYVKTRSALVLTNDKESFTFEEATPVTFMNEEEKAVEVRTAALGKLTQEEKAVLGVG